MKRRPVAHFQRGTFVNRLDVRNLGELEWLPKRYTKEMTVLRMSREIWASPVFLTASSKLGFVDSYVGHGMTLF